MRAHEKMRAWLKATRAQAIKDGAENAWVELGTLDDEYFHANRDRILRDVSRHLGEIRRVHGREPMPESDPFWVPERRAWFSWFNEDGSERTDADGMRMVAESRLRVA